VKKNEERTLKMLETMSTKRFGEDDHRTSVRENTSYSRTLNKGYIGLSS
jgi:hypothetical protein